jgi:hypothetical protein
LEGRRSLRSKPFSDALYRFTRSAAASLLIYGRR